MSRVLGRSFKISKNQAKGYGYAKPGMKRNPGVTTIAAINGRGSYATANRSARSVMSKLKRNARPAAARRALTASEKAAFKARMDRARGVRGARPMSVNRSTSSLQSASSRKNIRKAQSARKAWGKKLPRGKRVRVGSASYGRKPKARRLKAGVYVANRRKKAGSKTMARRRKRAAGPTKKRRSSKRRRKSTTKRAAAPRKRRKARKGKARRKTVARKTTRKRRRRSTKKTLKANRRRRVKRAAPKRRRKARKGKARRKTTARKTTKRRSRRKLKANGRRRSPRRKHRRNASMKTNRRRKGAKRSHKSNRRRRHRRNGRSLFRKNSAGGFIKMGAVLFGGFALHRLLSNLVSDQLLARLMPAPAAPAATNGFDLSGQRGLIASLLVGAGGSYLASRMIKNEETKKLVIGGMVASTIHGVVISVLKAFSPRSANMLAGPEESTATRLAAMFGLGGAASIMPNYYPIGRPVNGMGEYFAANGLGEFFSQPTSGLGEYFAATNGLGTYEPNSDLLQAAAGMGSHDYQGNHIDPSGDLDRQLTIAEAAAGVGELFPYSAAAGMGAMQAAAGMRGFGAIDTVPSGDTWIPGTTDGALWAGVRSITNDQGVNQMQPAGVLETEGGQGIFG